MPMKVPSLEELTALMVDDGANRLPGRNWASSSNNYKRVRTTALGITGLHAHIDTARRGLIPGPDSSTEDLDAWGRVLKRPRNLATAAHKAAALRVTGALAAVVAVGDALTHRDGTRYQVNSAGVGGAGGYVDVDILSIDTGPDTRKQKGEQLTFSSPPPGIAGTAILQLDVDEGGEPDESNAAYLQRIWDKLGFPGMGGNARDYATWAKTITGVANAYVYPLRNGYGSLDLAFLHSGRGAQRIPSADEIAEVAAYIDTVRPPTMKMFRGLTVVGVETDVELLLTPFDGPEWAFDWLDVFPPVVTAFDASTRVLTLSTRPSSMKAGARLSYKNTTTRNDGEELVVEALGPTALDVKVKALTTAQAAAPPEAGAPIYAGGPLVAPGRAAVLALFDGFGPGRGPDPNKVAGQWEDTLRISGLIGCKPTGTKEIRISTPADNVVPANAPPAATVELLIPRQIIVRRA